MDLTTLTPIEYEHFCRSQMHLEGWFARPTPATGDQGADVICEYGDFRAVIQCKLYSQPVGNAAVQEAISARIFYGADLAAVVTNAGFTKSATQLASKAKVALLNHVQLREWARKNRFSDTADYFQFASVQEIAEALNLRGFKVRKTGDRAFTVDTPDGARYVHGEGALTALATQLLGIVPPNSRKNRFRP